MHRAFLAVPLLMLFAAFAAAADTTLPIVEEVEWGPFRAHCRQLLKAFEETKAPLPAETVRAVQALLDRKPDDTEAAARAVQKLLDARCLLVVSINPESRVKAMRGPAVPELRQNHETLALIKVHNDGGVTHALRLRGPEIVRPGERDDGRWLQATVVTKAPFDAKLSGRRLEYRLLRLLPRQAGKREATFQFDVGQGTQDLGFRAEVPVLFSIQKPARKD
ncbi:MAG TPA: hypothetical protein VH682_10360 [Gemmataceae bacterium]|jgi:hypothetical protein